MRDRFKLFEGGCERVGKTPDRSGAEFFALQLEVKIVYCTRQMFRSFEFALDERLIDEPLSP